MAEQNLTNFDEALKIDYLPAIREQLNNSTVLLSEVSINERDVSGKRWQLTTHHGRNSGVGARADSGTLPTAGHQSYENPYGTVKYNYGRIQVTGKIFMNLGPFLKRLRKTITCLNSVNLLLDRTIPSEPLLVGV